MRYEILGPLRVVDGGTEVDVGGPRQRRVLAILLAAAPADVSVDRLIDEVWGDEAPSTSAHVIRTYVSNLKGVLGDRIKSDGRRYRLELDDDESDAAQLIDALGNARTLVEIDPAAALDRLDAALRLRRGRPFEGLADDALGVQVRADALEEQWLQGTELRMDAALRLGRHQEIVPELHSLARTHPLRERFSEQLMLALYRSERQAEALSIYRKLRRRLAEELGLDPSPALQELEERILLQDPALALKPPHNLPNPISSFIGRVDELGEVSKSIDAYRLVTLVGVGGVGKTRIAREVALSRLDGFPDGVWWIDLAPLDDPGSILPAIAGVLGISNQPGLPLEAVLRRYLAHRTTLVVLDNCEHLLPDAGASAAAVLDSGPAVKVLATSRRPLDVSGEARCSIPPMSLPTLDNVDFVTGTSDAERLFAARANDGEPAMGFDEKTAADAARVCVRLDGIPLAIEMAAARARVLTPGQIADRLELDAPGTAQLTRHRPASQTTHSRVGCRVELRPADTAGASGI